MCHRRRSELYPRLWINWIRSVGNGFIFVMLSGSHCVQLPWLEVKKEMTEEKGLPSDVADKIGEYVKHKGKQI